MALLQTPSFSATAYKQVQIDEPCKGGINLRDLEYEQNINQSPNVLNMMYRNGAFGKRYGQKEYHDFGATIYALGYFNDEVITHAGDKIYKGETQIAEGIAQKKGLFINFNGMLYYLCDKYYQYDEEWKEVEPHVPQVLINRKPDGSYEGDTIDEYNLIGSAFETHFNGDGTSTLYKLHKNDLPLDEKPLKIFVDEKEVASSEYTVDYAKGEITFKTAPSSSTNNNVKITAYKTVQEDINKIMKCTLYATYGGNNNSRLFLAGGGDSCFYYSGVADATYFPAQSYARIGNDEDDIQGFGEQYDVLMLFKSNEIYGLEYYTDDKGVGRFSSKRVNSKIGCDAPNSIQLINNQLVWLSSKHGVCTLVSTNIEDERNVRVISRNIDGGYRVSGLLQEENLQKATSTDFEGKYFLSVNGKAYVWDYLMSPYANTGRLDDDAKRLSWFLFDNFYVDAYVNKKHDLLYSKGSKLVILTNDYSDFGNPIQAKYQTPFMQFEVNYLKTIKNMYVQCRADTASVINITYFTEETPYGEKEPEPIIIYGKMWNKFLWNTFGWSVVNFANVFRRKCSLKKIQMASVLFDNNELDRDMSISHLSFEYAIIKSIK